MPRALLAIVVSLASVLGAAADCCLPAPQHATTTTGASNGSFSVTFARPFLSTTPVCRAATLAGSTAPQLADCAIDTIANATTSPVVSGHCSVSAPAAALGNSGEQALASGATVMVSCADRTQ